MRPLTEPRQASTMLAALARFQVPGAILLAVVLGVKLTWPLAELVWTTGGFIDPDDAMRAVQVRDLLNGQAWFDMTSMRLDPPHGMFSHWSRVVDAPLAALETFFRIFFSAETAERITRLIFPLALLATLYALAARNARILGGGAARLPAVLLTFLSGAMFGQFQPGRIDHHAPQIVLLMTTVGFFLQGLDPLRARAMAFAAAAMALSFAISLENAPFFIVLLAFLTALFAREGVTIGPQLRWFAAGVFVAFPLCFVATVGPSRYFISTCDAYSTVHILAATIGALGFIALATASDRLESFSRRLIAIALVGAATLASIVIVAPHCIGDPLGELDPLLRDLWLSHNSEVQPASALSKTTANGVVAVTVPVALGLLAALVGAWKDRGVQQSRWLALACVIAIGFLLGLWKVRVFTSVTPLAMTPLAVAVVIVTRRLASSLTMATARASVAILLCLAVSPMGLALAPVSGSSDKTSPEMAANACQTPQALTSLTGLPPSRIVASIYMGAHIMAHTQHSVFAAPYHRDNHGNRLAVDAFLAQPAEAEEILRAAGANLMLWCPNDEFDALLAKRSPHGLAASLAQGSVPAWLEAAPIEGTPYRIFVLRRTK